MHIEDEDIDILDHNNIIRELDTDLVEIFRRGQFADLFADVPLQRQNERLERINELLTARNIDEYFQNRRKREDSGRYISCLWMFGLLPFPIFHFRRLWRRFGTNNVQESLVRLAKIAITTLMRIIRFGLFIIASSAYLHNILRHLFIFSNLLTFSNNFLRDIITFMSRNNSGLLERHQTIAMKEKGIFYFKEDADFQAYSTWDIITTAAYNWVSSLINMNCVSYFSDERHFECSISEDSLIFKFSRIMGDFFPSIGGTESNVSWSLTISTVVLYLFYALGGDLICLNVLFFFSINMGKRVLHYKDIYAGLGSIVWNTLHGNII
ncbi:uncharacterized protein AC631_05794 [Debaryomyces fabryi]|uniref:Uncharacterized protein n=1 Tax=Debaryomyces fabryi TaxID=58627 RepID=A0A0V1PQZ8_9ASCO|nr:uncharacterized protein AC631_05794 [Debaryomyces fabryi]KRZ98446.1 hypothetical protein AC631_05794 [Debaryomyces fabryi]CUM46057.1 unnamed protein product [Debaryomyces fabryi]